jgi:tetratricopeptide (TPR) repeat protein
MRNFVEKITLFVLQNIPTLVFFFVPIFFLTNTVDYFAFNKFYLLNIIATISLFFWCLNNILNKRISLTLSPALSALFVLVLAHFASALFMSPVKVLSLTGLTTLFTSLFIILLTYTSTSPSPNLIKRQIFALILSLGLVSVATILHFFNLLDLVITSDVLKSKYFNLTGGVIPALAFSLPLLLGILSYIFYTDKPLNKIFLFFVSGIIITASIINISLLLPSNGISPIVSLPFRASWSIALDIFKYPGSALIGTGPETYLATFTRLRPNYLNLNPSLWNSRFSESGSIFLTILTTTGLIGGISFLLSFLKSITLGLRSLRSSELKPELSFAIVSLLGFILAFAFSPAGLVSIIVSITLLAIATQILKGEGLKQIKSVHFNISTNDNQNNAISNFLPLASLILSLVLMATYWTFGSRFYAATTLLSQARQKITTDIAGSFLKQTAAQKLNTYDPTYQMVISQTFQQVALFYLQKENPTDQDKKNAIETMQRAIDSGRQAARLDPYNVMVWENLSNIYQSFIGAAEGATNLAVSHLAQAISLDPTNPRLRLQMGILYFNLKDKDAAIKLINQSIELKPDWEVPYINLYSIYMDSKEYLKAEANLKQAVALANPSSTDYEKLTAELKKLTDALDSAKAASTSGTIKK